MIRLTFFLLVSMTILKAWPYLIQVDSLEEGNCWIQFDKSNESFSFTSFVLGKAYRIFPGHFMNLENRVEEEFEKKGIIGHEKKYAAYLKCYSEGAKIFMNYFDGDTKLCVKVLPEIKDNKTVLTIEDILPNHNGKNGPCEGVGIGEIFVDLSKKFSSNEKEVEACGQTLQNTYPNELTLDFTNGAGVYKFKVGENYYYQENLIKDKILADKPCEGLIEDKNIVYNEILSISGTWHPLLIRRY